MFRKSRLLPSACKRPTIKVGQGLVHGVLKLSISYVISAALWEMKRNLRTV